MIQRTERIWMDGRLIPWEEARVHVLTHTLHYGLGVFEGIRCYACVDGRSAVFRLRDHVERLFGSAHIAQIPMPYTREEISQAILEVLRANGLKEAYIRPLVFIGDGEMGLYVEELRVHVTIVAWPWGAYLGEEGLRDGIRVKISSYTRLPVNAFPSKAKICGNYVNSILAKREAKEAGYDEAILLDGEGYVSEASGENVFMVKRGVLRTSPLASILEGITRESVIRLARDQGIPVVEERFTRDELYLADEAFLTGTAAEITPVREVDGRPLGEGRPGPITQRLQQLFFQVVRGRSPQYEGWLCYL